MNINTLTSSGVATSVWTNATRSLTADPATDAGAAALIWGHGTRTLTGDSVTFTTFQTRTSLANGGTLDLRPAAGKTRWVSVGCGAASVCPVIYDGTNQDGQVTATSATIFSGFGNNTTGIAMHNSNGAGQNVGYCGMDHS